MWFAGLGGNRPGVPLLAPAVLALAVCCALPGLAQESISLSVALAAVGAASGTLDVLMNACVGEMEAADGHRRMHLAHAVFSAGLFGSSVAAGLLRQAGLGYRPILAIAATLILMLSAAARQQGTRRRDIAPSLPPAGRTSLDGGLIGLGLLCGVAFMLENGMELWSALYLNRNLQAQPAIAALGPGLLGLSAVAGRLGGQALAGRLDDARLLASAGLVAALGVIIFTMAPTWPFALPALILSGSGISIAAPTFFGLAGSWAGPGKRGSAVSLVSLISYLGFLVGPLYLGAVSNAFGLRAALSTLAACAVALAVVGPLIIRHRARSSENELPRPTSPNWF